MDIVKMDWSYSPPFSAFHLDQVISQTFKKHFDD